MRILLIIAVFCLAGVRLSIAREDQTGDMRDELSLLVRRVNNLEEALGKKDNEINELQEKIENVQTEKKELQEKIEEVRNPPFGYFCSSGREELLLDYFVITYDKMLYSSQFGLQGDSPGIDINTGKFVAGISGTWRVDFSLYTSPNPGENINILLYKNGERIPEAEFLSYRSNSVSGYDYNTGGRSLLLHLDLGDKLHLATFNIDEALSIIFCVSLEQADF